MNYRQSSKECRDCGIKIPIFNFLTDEQLDMVIETICEVNYQKGEIIFKQGTVMSHLVIVTEGLVKAYIEGISNSKLILRFIRPFNLEGGPGFMTDYKHHFTLVAVEETTVCFIDANILSEIIKTNVNFVSEMMKYINIQTVAHYMKLIDLTQKGMHGRIATALLYLHNEIFRENNGVIRVKRQDLADLTAMSKESAIRILKEFKDENTIMIDSNTIILNDITRLARISLKG